MILFLHSSWAYVVCLALLVAVGNALYKKIKRSAFTSTDFRISLFALITVHIQLVLGLLRYVVYSSWSIYGSHSMMTNPVLRLRFLEHPLISILAVVFVTIGWSKHKKQKLSPAKFSKIILFYGLGLFLLLSRLPWFWS